MILSLARKKLAKLSARLATLKPPPSLRAGVEDLHHIDLINPYIQYPIIIQHPDAHLSSSFIDAKGVAHLRETDYNIYLSHH